MSETNDTQENNSDQISDPKEEESTTKTASPKQWLKISQKIYDAYVKGTKFLISTSLSVAFIFLAYQVGKDMFSHKVVIQPFTVPPSYGGAGINWTCDYESVDEQHGGYS